MAARLAGLLADFTPSVAHVEALAIAHLRDFFGCDEAHVATIGPRFVASSPAYFRRILADPQHFDPGQAKAREIVARCGPAFIDTEVYSPAERDRAPVFRELLRPAGISSIVLATINVDDQATGMIHLIRDGRPFAPTRLAEARPLLRAIAILHRAVVAAPAGVGEASRVEAAERVGRLSPRERQVAGLAASGHGALQIAAGLGTSIHTVRRQLEAVHRKCGIGNRAELASLIHQADVARPRDADASPLQVGLRRLLVSAGLHAAVDRHAWHALA